MFADGQNRERRALRRETAAVRHRRLSVSRRESAGLGCVTRPARPRTIRAEVKRDDGSLVGEGTYIVAPERRDDDGGDLGVRLTAAPLSRCERCGCASVLLVEQHGWTAERWEQWIRDTILGQFFPDVPPRKRSSGRAPAKG